MKSGINIKTVLLFVFVFFQLATAHSNTRIIQKEIIYYSPKSGEVFLVWGVNGWKQLDSKGRNKAKVIKSLLYTPMLKKSYTFRTTVFLPFGTTLDFVFKTSKNKKGQLTDIWDNNGAEGIDYHSIITDNEPIRIQANLSASEKKIGLIEIGWLLMIITAIIPGIFLLFKYIKKIPEIQISYSHKIIIIAFSLFIFLCISRFEIIAQLPTNWFQLKSYYKPVFAASISDLVYIISLSIFFLISINFTKNSRIQKISYYSFCFFAAVSLIVGVLNIIAVHYLGKPFNYRWLYYSGFLGSTEAKNAISQTGSIGFVLNIISLGIAMFLFAASILVVLNQLSKRVKMNYYLSGILLPLPMIVLFLSINGGMNPGHGKTDNPVVSFVSSFVFSQSNPSFFDIKIPNEYKYNETKHLTKIQDSVSPYSKVQNVLLVVLESAGAEYFDLYGGKYHITPNLNKYASTARIFDNMYANSPASNKSLVSILCSQYPWVSYKSLTQEHPDLKRESISSQLKKVGYRTSYLTSADSKFQNGNIFLSHREFDVLEDFSKIKCNQQFQFNNNSYKNGSGMDDNCIVNRFENWLDEDKTKPFFSMIWTNQGHYPYFVTGEEVNYGVENPDLNRYLNTIHHYDQVIGALMAALEQRKLTSSTLVIIVGDHGEAFGRHKQFGHATKLYEENIKIPMLLIHPDLRGERDSSLAELKDIASTALPLVGIKNPESWQGRNLLESQNNEAFFFAPWSDYLFAYRQGNMKYIFDETNEKIEVYNLKTDPTEFQNLSKSISQAEMAKVRFKMASWVQYQDQFVKKIILNR